MEALTTRFILILWFFIRTCRSFASFPVPHSIESKLHPIERSHKIEAQAQIELGNGILLEDSEYFGNYSELLTDYIFPRSAYVPFFGGDSTSLYGTAVYMTDEFAIVGSNGYNDLEGLVHVYVPVTETSWSLLTTIASPIADLGNFGCSVDQDESTGDIIIGADAFNLYTGQVYIYSFFDSDRDSWSLSGVLVSPEGKSQGFGTTVAISGNYSIVGNTKDQAYIFGRVNNTWTLLNSLLSPFSNDPLSEKQFYFENKTHFGQAVSISGNYAVVGAYQQNVTMGVAYIYNLPSEGSVWTLQSVLRSVGGENSYFGYSAHMKDNFLIVGAIGNMPNTAQYGKIDVNNTGFAYIYELMNFTTGPMWSLTSELQSPVGENVYFGHSVKLSANNAMVGAIGFPFNQGSGAAFIYTKSQRNNHTLPFPLSSREGDKTTYLPSERPSVSPTLSPSDSPTVSPSQAPSEVPSEAPSLHPSETPSLVPSEVPSVSPTEAPSQSPTLSQHPSVSPTLAPSQSPTLSQRPSEAPSLAPTHSPSLCPSVAPSFSLSPSESPSLLPSLQPSQFPTSLPSLFVAASSLQPSSVPTAHRRRSLLMSHLSHEDLQQPNDSWKESNHHVTLWSEDSLEEVREEDEDETAFYHQNHRRYLLETREEQIESQAVWVLNISLPSPAGPDGAFGYAVGVSDSYFCIGADNFETMRGAVYIGGLHAHGTWSPTSSPTPLATNATPTSQPSSQPSGQPTSNPTTEKGVNSVNNIFQKSNKKDSLGLWIAVALAAFCFCLMVCLCCLCCLVCCVPPPAGGKKKKKKKDGVEDSPYTIHGPGGELYTEEQNMSESVEDLYNRYLREEESSVGDGTSYGGSRASRGGLRYGVKAVEVVAEEIDDKQLLYGVDDVVLAEPLPPRSRLEAFQDYTDRALRKMNLLPDTDKRVKTSARNRAELLADYDNAAMMKIREFENRSDGPTSPPKSRRAMLADYDDAAMRKIREFDLQTAMAGRTPPRRSTSLNNLAGSDYLATSEGLAAEKEFYEARKQQQEGGGAGSALASLIRNAKLRGMVAKAKFDKLRTKKGGAAAEAAPSLPFPSTTLTADRGAVFPADSREPLGSPRGVNPAMREQEERYRELRAGAAGGDQPPLQYRGPGQSGDPFDGSLSLVEKSRLRYAEYRRKAAENISIQQQLQQQLSPDSSGRLSEFEEHNRRELAWRHAEEERLRAIPLSGGPAAAPQHHTSPRQSRPTTPKDEAKPFSPSMARAAATQSRRSRLGSVSDDSDEAETAGDLFFASPHAAASASADKADDAASSSSSSTSNSSVYRPQQVDLIHLSQRQLMASSGIFDAMEGGSLAVQSTPGSESAAAPPPAAAHRPLGQLRSHELHNTSLFMQQLELQHTEASVTAGRRGSASAASAGLGGQGGNLSPHASSIMQSQNALMRQDSAERDMDADLEEVRRRYRSQSPTAVAAAAAAARERLAADLYDLQIPNISPQSSSRDYAAAVMSDINATSENDSNSSGEDSNADAWKQFYRDNKPAGRR